MFKIIVIIGSLLLTLPLSVAAKEVVGKVQSAIHMSKVIQYINPKTKQVSIIKYDDSTILIDAESFKDFTVNTKFKAEVNETGYASKLKRILVQLPENEIIDTDTLADLLDAGEPVFIGDARPTNIYNSGHIPTAQPTPANELAKNINWLPKDKDSLIVFYCGGVTCPLSPAALNVAKANGFNNVKAYVTGFPAWKEEVYPVHVTADWLTDNLNNHTIILDVRETPSAHIVGAIHMPVSKITKRHDAWNQEKFPVSKRTIFDLRDKKAPIIIVADTHDSDEAIEAYEVLTYWKLKNVTILAGGMDHWTSSQLPIDTGTIGKQLVYEKKLVKGAIEEMAFIDAIKEEQATIIDVRNPEEVTEGRIKGSINIPLAVLDQQLADVPKDHPVILHCVAGARASMAYTLLSKKGYTNVMFLNDTFLDVMRENGITLH